MTPDRASGRIDVYDVYDEGPFATEPTLAANATVPQIKDIIGDTGSSHALQWLKDKLGLCDSTHKHCEHRGETSLPRRILDVGGTNDSSAAKDQDIRLIETKHDINDYICLSHCWGSGEMFRTTKENISERMHNIHFNDLPATFKDAVRITRDLGKRYLWIDSLCIIQNDPRDWREEGLRMHEVYGNSYLTIAASKTKGPDDGLFSVSSQYKLQQFFFVTDRQQFVMRVRQKISHFNSIDSFPLLKRGWVFQERILSRRMVHFGPQELVWECMEMEECECGNVDEGISWNLHTPRKSHLLIGGNVFLWNRIAAAYSSLSLTKENDVLPALSGIAKKHKPEPEAKYLAGFWDGKFLVIHLMWYVQPTRGLFPGDYKNIIQTRPSPWRAPSWSWASVKSAVIYNEFSKFYRAVEIDETRIIPTSRDATGEVIYGELKLRGSTTLVTCHMPEYQSGTNHQQQLHIRCMDLNVRNLALFPDYDWSLDQNWWIHEGQSLLCLYLATTRSNTNNPDGVWNPDEQIFDPDDDVWMMLLAKFTREEPVCQRVGMARLKWKDYKQQEEFRGSFKELGAFPIC
ncbi:hypothetical protein COCSADRAFT_34907 [Bipolaris sorokiniana ND90Pr]|nr:uncharacterized protein COCSADRAFT_34907 [Bipolaris sorokiniana ND90Pr]EMD66339.1 hypothetical protein COCSADRAFT_34907 [Bipolaris sorokiniana ND90Pr]